MWGVETFNPQLKERRSKPTVQNRPYIVKSLFPSYIFARFNAELMLHKICFTRGVRKIVSFNGQPVPVEQEVIDLIKARVQEDGFIRIGQNLRTGDKVMIVKGPLTALEGIFEKDLNESDRVVILLTTVNYQSRLLVDKELIKKVS
jgi:transcriptional antiterminator RfaH